MAGWQGGDGRGCPSGALSGCKQGDRQQGDLLGGNIEGSRSCERGPFYRGRHDFGFGPQGDGLRSVGPLERDSSGKSFAGPFVPRRLSRSSPRRTSSCRQDQTMGRRGGIAMDEQSGGGTPDTNRWCGRAGFAEAARSRSGRGGREGSGPSSRSIAGRKPSKGELLRGHQGEARQAEKEEEKEEGEGQSGWHEVVGEHLREHMSGPVTQRQEGVEEACQEGGKAQDRSRLVGEYLNVRPFLREHRGRPGRPPLRGRSQGETGGHSVPGRPDSQHGGVHDGRGGTADRSAMGGGEVQHTSGVPAVLAAGPGTAPVRANAQGDSYPGIHPGLAFARKGGECHRRGDPEVEVAATDFPRGPLHSGPEARDCAAGPSHHEFAGRNSRSSKVTEGGRQGKSSSLETMGTQVRMGRPTSRGNQRKGKDQGKRQRQRKEQGGAWRQGEGGCEKGQIGQMKGGESGDSVAGTKCGTMSVRASPCGRGGADGTIMGPPTSGVGLGPTRASAADWEEEFHSGVDSEGMRPGCPPFQFINLEGLTMAEAAVHFSQFFEGLSNKLAVKHCKSKSSGCVFPLPETSKVISSLLSHLSEAQVNLLQMMCRCLNSYYGVQGEVSGTVGQATVSALQRMSENAETVSFWQEKFEGASWGDFLAVKSVDYRGEEVRIARTFRWENIEPALPAEVGTIRLEDVCELGTLDYVVRFENYLLPEESQVVTRPPRVMVDDDAWEQVCSGLVQRGVCDIIPLSSVYHVQNQPVLSGLFGVSKDEFHEGWETFRLIMNLVPVNKLCRNIAGDVATLPTWSGMSSFVLDDGQFLLLSSEDIRCFFYLFLIPQSWRKYMAFAKEVPRNLNPQGSQEPHVLASRVLPMGFLNSVSIAQHIHRRIARLALRGCLPAWGPETELRKDKSITQASRAYRIYLDNFDTLERVDCGLAGLLKGEASAAVLALRSQYTYWGLPRHPKKSVQQQLVAEVQGAIVDGVTGQVWPKPVKILKYAELGWLLLKEGRTTQKQLQIVCGGLVYCAMFRRPLLGMLNSVWRFILQFQHDPPVVKRALPFTVQLELGRFLCALPFAHMSLRLPVRGDVSVSDASEQGGGFCISRGLTPMGAHAAACTLRGDLPELEDHIQVLTIGLFDGIGALRVACDLLQLPMAGHASAEVSQEATRVLESHFPDTCRLGAVEAVTAEVIQGLACKFTNAGVVLVGAGPPCQGVSGLNSDRKGALRDARSSLFGHVSRVYEDCKKAFPWAQVHYFMESVFSMDVKDRVIMSKSIGCVPWMVDSFSISACRRPRLYWLSWELESEAGITIVQRPTDSWESYGVLSLTGVFDPKDYIASGWDMCEAGVFPTFTTARPRSQPGNRPAGVWQCAEHELQRWRADQHRYPPYIYRDQFCLRSASGEYRLPTIGEKEVCMGFPLQYTAPCLPKGKQHGDAYNDIRHTLIGNSWHVVVVTSLLRSLFHPLGLSPVGTIQEILDGSKPGGSDRLATFLQRLPPRQERKAVTGIQETDLAKKLVGLVSIKGEDLLLQASTENQVRFHRLRSSVPARLWRWKTVCGWKWKIPGFHINALEMQAALTAVRWRLARRRQHGCRMIHLTDSLVALHALSRGRSSSRRLRPILSKINSLALATNVQFLWAYVSTKQNPADRPSRAPVQKRWLKAKHI